MEYSSSAASEIKYVVFLSLLIISILKGVESKQLSDNVPQIKYDVFVNFRGEDIRHSFLGYLTEAFHQHKIYAFVDDKLGKGDEIWPSLVGAIKGSLISLTIFSENYASSRWCLEELVQILEFREKYGQIVLPVFYHVYPKDVRHQKRSYEKALAEHEKKYNFTTVQNWRHALKKAANLSGIKSFDYMTEVELLGEVINIINLVLRRLGEHPLNLKGVVGIEKQVQYLESLLLQESTDVRVIGIWGMGGIGKTTIAEEIFNKLYSKYDGHCFLANVKEETRGHGTISLKEKMFSMLLAENVKVNTANGLSNYIKRKIGRMKVLIVLDDVNDSDLLEKLFGNHGWLRQGSRIIITTRDKQVLIANKVDDIYQVGALKSSEAIELFSLYAFNQNNFDMEYYKLSKRVVNYAKGIPLVLKVLGHLLCGKDKEVWESQLDKLKNMPNTDVHNAMKLSYDDLDRKEQKIFLNLACFFVQLNLKVDRIKDLLKDGERDNSVIVGIERLKDKALITISEDNVISMHDIIQEMAWEIVRHESIEDPGSRSRLRDVDDIHEVLQNNKGTEAIRSIRGDSSVVKNLRLSPYTFTKMSKLQFLYFPSEDVFDLLPQGLHSLPVELRYLAWTHYPLKSLPENFSAEKLVILDLSDSQVENLWDGVQNLMNLKEVKLSGSKSLKELPDLSKATNLEELYINSCPQLTSVSPSIFSLKKLEKLDLGFCSLTKIISRNHLSSLSYFNLIFCNKLREFSVTSENLVMLDLSFTPVNALPSSFGRQSKLEILLLINSGIQNLPSDFKNLTRLRYLNAYNSTELHTLTELPPSLQTLDITGCTLLKTVWLPSISEQLKESRREVLFWNCLKLNRHSLKAIGLNAHINVMKFAYHHLSAPDENYDDYDRNYRSYQVRFVYPGSRIPEWLEYKTTKDYVVIDLSSTPRSSPIGFIFCFVISGPKVRTMKGYGFIFYITITKDEDESKKDSIYIYMYSPVMRVASDHVCVIYDQRCSHYLNNRAKTLTKLKIKVKAIAGNMHHQQGVGLKGFGVSPINTSAYHSFMERINPRATAYHNVIQQINASADHSFFQQMHFIPMLAIVLFLSLLWLRCRL
ncbi:disease resistance protein RPV1-like [Phaseolus vulgaris]|uniref:disease resistance protein RPV1-like n=1 Tax=Phaseolus vulgaris TaxID=3885 RepID=UPI0035CA176A